MPARDASTNGRTWLDGLSSPGVGKGFVALAARQNLRAFPARVGGLFGNNQTGSEIRALTAHPRMRSVNQGRGNIPAQHLAWAAAHAWGRPRFFPKRGETR